jgi:thioredoxin type arsenate reductase
MTLGRKVIAEGLGTMLLLAAIVGSGIMAERLSNGNVALALLANAVATGSALVAIILAFDGISGAHFNPLVTLVVARERSPRWPEVSGYVTAQVLGAVVGVAVAHLMFGEPLFAVSGRDRAGAGQVFSEFLATFGLLSIIRGCSAFRPETTAFAVGAYITAAYWFTASTSFANPAVTLARSMTNTFAGIRPQDVPAFVGAQLCGAWASAVLWSWLLSTPPQGLQSLSMPGFLKGNQPMADKKRVLFLCTGNSARSQMAEGLLRERAGDEFDVFSAGTHPKGLHPRSIEVMKEIGIDISNHTSKDVDIYRGDSFHYVITVCDRAKQQCPVFPGAEPIHWGFDDPAEAPANRQIEAFRHVRDEIRQRINLFLLSNKQS